MTTSRFFLDVPFKGSRTYLHSTNIFNEMLAHVPANQNLALSFKRIVTRRLEAIDAASCPNPDSFPVRFRGESAGTAFDFVIAEGTEEVTRRIPYDEEAVSSEATVSNRTIESRGGDVTLIERIVALNKRLIVDSLKPDKKLYFTSIALARLLPADAPLTLKLDSHLGARLFRSSIYSNAARLGDIVFYGV